MNKLVMWMEEKLVPIAGKIGNERHLVALRDGFIGTMPATMAGSIALLLNAFLRDFPGALGWDGFVTAMVPIVKLNNYVWAGSLAVVALMFSISFGYNLAKAHDVDPFLFFTSVAIFISSDN